MNIMTSDQFAFLTSNPKTFYKIVEHENAWFYTIDIYNTEESSGIGRDNTRIIKQTWELIDYVPSIQNKNGHFLLKMWGEEPSPYNGFTNTIQHEGKSILAPEDDVIFRLNMLVLQNITQNSSTDFKLINYRNCQGIRDFYQNDIVFPKGQLDELRQYNGQNLIFEILVHPEFKFPGNTIANNFSKTSIINMETQTEKILSKKMFSGNIQVLDNKINILNSGNNTNMPDTNYLIELKFCRAGHHFIFKSNDTDYQTEFIIDSFSVIPN